MYEQFLSSNDKLEFSKLQKKANERLKDVYTDYVRPYTGSLLRTLNLDLNYVDGNGNWLTARLDNGENRKILDATGGYGANFLGHKNPQIINTMVEGLTNGSPSNVQGSLRAGASALAKRLSETLATETDCDHWITTLTNSGTESVEAALKLAYMKYNLVRSDIEKRINQSYYIANDALAIALIKKNFNYIKALMSRDEESLEMMRIIKTPKQLIEYIYRRNLRLLEQAPMFLALEGAFHGKTLGSLTVTYSPSYRKSFYSDQSYKTTFIERNDTEALIENFKKNLLEIIDFKIVDGELVFKPIYLSKYAGAIVEPIQGEAGVHELDREFLTSLRDLTSEYNTVLIFDEIQAGMYRTGKLASGSHSNITADIYTFSKTLGAGVAKIGAMVSSMDAYVPEFGYLHTSTFAEDDLSSNVARKALDLLQDDNVQKLKFSDNSMFLKQELIKLKTLYPKIIKEVRGIGYMLALEFSADIRKECFEFKTFDDANVLGHFFCSALLHNERIRITPTLSSPRTIRIQPSFYTDRIEIEYLIRGIRNLLNAIENMDMPYFFKHVYPGHEICGPAKIPKGDINYQKSEHPVAAFFCHVIDVRHALTLSNSTRKVPADIFQKKLSKVIDVVEFDVYYRKVFTDKNGKKAELILMGIPVTSADIIGMIKAGRKNELVEKVQRGMTYAKELGATTIGLGQFTSIMTDNGTLLNADGLNITTGNAYTTALGVQAGIKAAVESGLDLKQTTAACIGAAGNIVSTSTSLIADYVKDLVLVYHTPLQQSVKLQGSIATLLKDIAKSTADNPLTLGVQKLIQEHRPQTLKDIVALMNLEEMKKYIRIETTMEKVKECELVLTGASSTRPILFAKDFKENAVVIDIGVPGNVDKNDVREKRPDVKLILGGIAALPMDQDGKRQQINSPVFPLRLGEAYACLSETMILTFAGAKDKYNVGHLNKNMILEIEKIADDVGFSLGNFKYSNSL
jgi:acetylornithine/succinyldiaminopimelate/putrescine aminotransferase/predicted amino acid dehydrogenase